MNRSQLEHAIRAVGDLAGTNEVIVVGSQAILGQYPDAPAFLRRSMELDVVPLGRLDAVDKIDGVMGQMSQFEATHGFHVDAVDLESIKLPRGWRERLHEVRNSGTRDVSGYCLDASDIAASKLAAFREKDREYVRALLDHNLVAWSVLAERIGSLELDPAHHERLTCWLARNNIETTTGGDLDPP